MGYSLPIPPQLIRFCSERAAYLDRVDEALTQNELDDVEGSDAHLGVLMIEGFQHLLQVQLHYCTGHAAHTHTERQWVTQNCMQVHDSGK